MVFLKSVTLVMKKTIGKKMCLEGTVVGMIIVQWGIPQR